MSDSTRNIKNGRLVQKRWTSPKKKTINSFLDKYWGQRDTLTPVDPDNAAVVHQSASDSKSLLHPQPKTTLYSTKKHFAKQLNMSLSLSISPENNLGDTKT